MRPSPIALIALVTSGLITAAIVTLPGRADAQNLGQNQIAQNYPWCLLSSAYEGGENCGFSSFEQCQASRLGIGGFCQLNSDYRAGAAPASPYPSRPRSRS